MTSSVGHESIKSSLNQLIKAHKVPNSMIFSGPASIGKFKVAQELCQALICLSPEAAPNDETTIQSCKNCRHCLLFEQGSYPDLKLIQAEDEAERDIDYIRKSLNALTMQSFTGGARVMLIRDAERISVAAANMMLKAIEESRNNTYFIFTTSSLGKIPNTVRSRSQTLNFSPLSPEQIDEVLKLNQAELLKQTSEKILKIALATGTINSALQTLAQGDKLFELESLFEELKAGSPAAGFKLANFIHEQKSDGRASVLTLIDLVHRQLISNTGAKQRPWCLLLENLQTAERLIWDRHLNSQYLLANIFNSFVEQQTCRNKPNQSEITLNDLFEESI